MNFIDTLYTLFIKLLSFYICFNRLFFHAELLSKIWNSYFVFLFLSSRIFVCLRVFHLHFIQYFVCVCKMIKSTTTTSSNVLCVCVSVFTIDSHRDVVHRSICDGQAYKISRIRSINHRHRYGILAMLAHHKLLTFKKATRRLKVCFCFVIKCDDHNAHKTKFF